MDRKDNLHILFVCTGNTCRSPMAGALAKKLLAEAGIEGAVSSAGVSAYNEPASPNAVKAMEMEGLDLSGHRSQRVTAVMLAQATVALTMTRVHRDMLHTLFPEEAGKVFTLAEYAGGARDVSDPYGMDIDAYTHCAGQIKGLIMACIEKATCK